MVRTKTRELREVSVTRKTIDALLLLLAVLAVSLAGCQDVTGLTGSPSPGLGTPIATATTSTTSTTASTTVSTPGTDTARTSGKQNKKENQATGRQDGQPGTQGSSSRSGSGAGKTPASAIDIPNDLGFPGTVLLGRPTDVAATLSLLADSALEAYVEYGFVSGTYGQRTADLSLAAGIPRETTLTGLRSDSPCFYRLRYRSSGGGEYLATAERSFHTARAPGSAFTFAVQADPHIELDGKMQPALFIAELEDIRATQPDFLVDLGDTFFGEKLAASSLAQLEAQYAHDRRYFGIPGPSVPLYLANGNHEGEWGWALDGTPNNLSVWAAKARTTYYLNPFPDGFYTGNSQQQPFVGLRGDYYTWEWGDALFVVIDPYFYTTVDPKKSGDLWDYTLGTQQYRWLEATLKGSTAKHKFVFAHHILGDVRGGVEWSGLYEWGGAGKSGQYEFAQERPGWDLPIHQLMAQTGVGIFFQGHDHFFVKQEKDGVVYQEVPQPATPGGDPQNMAHQYAYKSGDVLASPGYLQVTVDGANVRVDYRQAGRTVYSYTLQ
jgi:hypothetical protein